ncbi:MAG: anti-phage ZorAB system protein ZorA [Formosimonas sp.]
MEIEDIFFKLLPFTFKDGTGVHFGFSELNAGDWIVTGFIVVLLGIFGWSFRQLRRSKRKDAKTVADLHDLLIEYKGKMSDEYTDFVAKLAQSAQENSELSELWDEFDESLIKTTNSFTQKIEIRNSIDAEYFFNKHTLLTHLGSKYYAAIPSILLGIGLIGTFFGLFYGLVQLNMGADAETLKTSMGNLINAAGVKFAASIWGLGLSLFFTWREKSWESQLEQRIEKIQWLVNTAFTRKTAEQSLAVMEVQAIAQTAQLNNLAISLTDDSVNKLSDALGQKIKETLEIAIGEPIQQMTRNIGGTAEHTLYDSMKSFSSGMGNEFVAGMRNMMNEVLKEIRQTTGTDATQLQNTLSTLTQTLNNLRQTFDVQNKELQNSMTRMVGLVQALSDTQSKQTQDLGEKSTQVTTQMSQTVQESLAAIGAQLEQFTKGIDATFTGLQTTIEQSKTQLAPVPEYLRQFANSTESLKTSAASADSGASKITQSTHGLGVANEALTAAMAGFATALVAQQSRMSDVSIQLGQSAEHAEDIAHSTEATYARLAQSYSELLEKNAQSVASFTEQVKAYQQTADENIKKTLGAFDAQLKDFASSLSGAIGELNDAVEGLSSMMGRKS